MRVEVVSASANPRPLEDVPAAVYVLTAGDIRRSGARTLPELLRRVPGMEVARIDDHTWAVTARAFNSRFANLLLVLVDGRPVYTPTFGGVYWDAQNVPLWNVERVEVIRGPGGALWGANAVNGVINVITRDAASVRGTYTAAGRGDDERAYVAARQGVALGDRGDLSLYAQAFDRQVNDWNESRGGFRWDRHLSGALLSVQGEGYGGGAGRTAYFASLTPPSFTLQEDGEQFRGGHLMVSLRRGDDADGWQARVYTTREERRNGVHGERVRTDALELRRARRLGPHGLTVGGGVHRVVDTEDGSLTQGLDPPHEDVFWYDVLIQDDIVLTDAARLTLGTQVEWNPYTGREHLPSARALWRLAPRHAVWAAASRAVRVPTRSFGDALLVTDVIPGTPPTLVEVVGDPDAEATSLTALEAGYRGRPAGRLSLDLAVFLNRYDGVNTLESGTPFVEADPAPTHLVSPLVLETYAHGKTRGVEAAVNWQAAERLRVTLTYTWLRVRIEPDPTSADLGDARGHDGSAPQQQLGLGLRADPARGVALDLFAKVVDQLPSRGIPAYVDLTARAAWRPRAGLTLSVTGEHLLTDRHREFDTGGATDIVASDVPRIVFARVTWAP
jgi:iron complex outermembrane receptor protein